MRIVPVDGQSPDTGALEEASSALSRGDLIIYPTDTLYALGGRAYSAEAGRKARLAKGREEDKPFPVIAADRDQAESLSRAWPASAERLARAFWPGPLTLVLPAAAGIPREVLAGSKTVAVRVPALELARRLCARAGPLVSTSANAAGAPPPLTCLEAVTAVGFAAALALDAGPGKPVSSTIVDLTSEPPRLLRAGPVPWEEIGRVLIAQGS